MLRNRCISFLSKNNINMLNKVIKILKSTCFYKLINMVRVSTFFIIWSIIYKKSIYNELQVNGIKYIKPYKWMSWKNGVYYFIGFIDTERVFIKTNGIMNSLKQEQETLSYVRKYSSYLQQHTPYMFRINNIIVERMLEGDSLDVLYNHNECEKVVEQLFDIYKELRRLRVSHCDIRPENFILQKDGNVILIDFGFALINSNDAFDKIAYNEKNKKIIKYLGGEFAVGNGTVDDAYSMLLTMKFICPSLMKKHNDIWRKLNEDIGRFVVGL